MAEKKELTKKQIRNKQKAVAFGCRIGEIAVVPVPFVALMIANRDAWFSNPDSATNISVGAGLTIGLLIAAIIGVMIENKDKNIDLGYPILISKWIMATIIISVIENVLHTISGIMWIALSGLGASYGLDITRKVYTKKANKTQAEIDGAELEIGKEQARKEILEEETKKVKVRIKK